MKYCRSGVSHDVHMLRIGLADYTVHRTIDRLPWAFDIFAAHLSKKEATVLKLFQFKDGGNIIV